MVYCLDLVTSNCGSALVVEQARVILGRLGLPRPLHDALRVRPGPPGPRMVGVAHRSWIFLGPLGDDYADHSPSLDLLLLLATSAPRIRGCLERRRGVQRHLLVLAGQGDRVSVPRSSSPKSASHVGLVGVGLAWPASQTIVAVLALVTSLPMVWVGIIPAPLLTWASGRPVACAGDGQVAQAKSVITKLAAEASFDASNWQLMTSDNQSS